MRHHKHNSRYLVSETRAVDTSTGLCQLVKMISICMDKRKKNGEIFVYFFADERYLRLSKICSLGIALPYVYYLYKKGFKYCNCSQCKNYNLNNKPYKNFKRTLQEVFCIEKNKWKNKFVYNVTVNYVKTILLNSKYLSKCIH